MSKRLVLIDGMSVFYRGYFAMPGLSLSDGTPTGGVFGFASIAIEVIKKLEPDYIAVAWDIRGTSTAKRSEIFADYKAGRTKPPDDFYAQLPILHALLESFGWPLYELDQYEADDIMGTVALQAAEKGIETCIVTGDYDMMQLISPSTKVYITKKGSELIYFDDDSFFDKYGVRVDQFIDYKALVGDKSDNIPGVRKIGPKAAESLLTQYGDLDGIYAHIDELKGAQKQNLIDDKANAYMSQQLARIFCDVPVEFDWKAADINNTDLPAVAAKLKELEFHSLIKRLPKHMQEIADTSLYFHESEEVTLKEKPWPETVSIDGPMIIHVEADELWVAFDSVYVTHTKIDEIDTSFWRAIEFGMVVSYDIKQLYHDLAAHNVSVRFNDIHDIRQAAFLLDPLRRDRSLSGLIGAELSTPTAQVAAARQIYGWQVEAFKTHEQIADIAKRFDFPLIYVLFLMEHKGIKIDPAILEKMSKELGDEHVKLEQEMYKMAGYDFNIASPAQLSEVLFTKLQLPTAGIKKGKTGYSTGQKELDKLKGQHPIIELIERTRELAKLKNTYVDTLPTMADAHGRIHTTFNQDVAATGRLSSTNPNLQNIPVRTDLGRKIREAFMPEGDKVFISADYSQFELRLAAILAGDKEMINDFNGDVDIHTKTASEVYGIAMDDVTKSQRRDAKVINFGVLYGMSPHGLSAATGMNFVEAKKFIDRYFELRSPIRKYIDDTLAKARTDGYVATYFGRRRPTPDILSSNFMVRQGAERAAANMPIQGTEADLMKLAMIKVDEQLEGMGEQILQIHDSILIEAPAENADKIAKLLKSVMENIAPELGIKLKVDVSIGKNWGEL
ncbi:DNA polymerase I [Patescibacteria group bacterium]|nr:MAG: DNA polymerase I [Patescibacteria group bacterium]